jgi:hypothetical protein
MAEFHGLPSGVGRRIVVLASRFNEPIVKKLVDGALEALVKYGVLFEDIDVVWVPGAWELPTAARWLLASERYDGLVALGAGSPRLAPIQRRPLGLAFSRPTATSKQKLAPAARTATRDGMPRSRRSR